MAVSTLKGNTRSEQVIYGNYCKAKRIGNVVEIWGDSNDYSIGRSYKSLTTLPQAYRPSHYVQGTGNNLGGNKEVIVHISEAGLVQLYASESTSYWEFDITYLVD